MAKAIGVRNRTLLLGELPQVRAEKWRPFT